MAKATSSQAWLWHRRLSHLNFDTINLLSKNNIVNGLPLLKFIKDHLCSSCELGKEKRKSFHTKTTPSSKRRLQLLHMDLYGLMRVESINGKKYVLIIVDDSRYTWTHFLRSKDETPVVLIDFLILVQRGLHAQAEAIATAVFTQTRSLVILEHEKTPYHIINARKPSVKFFHIFGSLCYIIRDGENLDKMKEKASEESDHVSSDPGPQCSTTVLEQDSLSPGPQSQENVPQIAETVTTSNELELLYSPMFMIYSWNFTCCVKSPLSTSIEHSVNTSNSNSKQREALSRHVDWSNMHTFYQHHPSAQRWTKDHPLEQVIGNPSQSVRTRRQQETDGELCMFALTVSRTELKNIKEAMADSAWIESIQEELHQFDQLYVWELVDIPLCKNVIN
ncbi:retrovirus-related pol polyprotein from transposon TNT 1-94 [Tanacetum coccineum]|uniref:Retrovirus-related pol polyprotein from transposon TNT 1-94 n=1 Tax=Tanacetum coccineum TaxID=301880 RepID=A0ABQ5BX13_9ASTR